MYWTRLKLRWRSFLVAVIGFSLIGASPAFAGTFNPLWNYVIVNLTTSSPVSTQSFAIPGTHYYQPYAITGISDSTTVQIYIRGGGTLGATTLSISDTVVNVIDKATGNSVAFNDDGGTGASDSSYSSARDSYLSLSWKSSYEIQPSTYNASTTGFLAIYTDVGTLALPNYTSTTSIGLTANAITANKRTSVTITATVSQPGRVTFFQAGRKIPGCISVAAVSTTATCNWKPILHGPQQISAILTPTSVAYPSSTGYLTVTIKPRVLSR